MLAAVIVSCPPGFRANDILASRIFMVSGVEGIAGPPGHFARQWPRDHELAGIDGHGSDLAEQQTTTEMGRAQEVCSDLLLDLPLQAVRQRIF